jgi:hypothetical protein
LSTDRPENGRENGSAYWTAFKEITDFQVLGD